MVSSNVLRKYAELVVKIGANVQENQVVNVICGVENYELAREVVRACYLAKAKAVYLDYSDSKITRLDYLYQDIATLCEIPDFVVLKKKYLIDNKMCVISIASPDPMALAGIDPNKLQKASQASKAKLAFAREYTMKNLGQWTIITAPCQAWANKVFPKLSDEEALESLWEAILKASRVSESNNPLDEWNKHIDELCKHCRILDNLKLKKLHFKNTLGTDVTIGLADDYCWCGGAEYRDDGVRFAPNIPTEEIFCMPSKYEVNGTVVATKPLSYQGNLIDKFTLEFAGGKVVAYKALRGEESLKSLIEFDEGSCYLGEVALLSHDSPISQMDILFYNSLFDENASCHLALGQSYAMNVIGGTKMSKEELENKGANFSSTHVDFMFGSCCMNITGICADGTEIAIFKDGKFVV